MLIFQTIPDPHIQTLVKQSRVGQKRTSYFNIIYYFHPSIFLELSRMVPRAWSDDWRDVNTRVCYPWCIGVRTQMLYDLVLYGVHFQRRRMSTLQAGQLVDEHYLQVLLHIRQARLLYVVLLYMHNYTYHSFMLVSSKQTQRIL